MKLDFSKSEDGLIPAIAQDWATNEVLMLAYINEEAWNESLKTGNATYWSRSRNKLWKKGESSGNVQEIKEIYFDCDEDTVIFKINQIGGAACHVGYKSCFYRKLDRRTNEVETIGKPVFDPSEVYNK
ncbi:MAG TPA: phosphoribosyl-AMP cyclohydrolase [Victivallales bacterium]|nr:phosphoribosyl-AMP cyclohydrolase [Victivallales bacterium]